MKLPKGKGFDLTGGLTVTVILDDGIFLTGRILGVIGDEDRKDEYAEYDKKFPSKHDDKCKEKCPPPKVEIENEVNVEDGAEFLLLQLTCAFAVGGLPAIAVGTIVAVNVEQILFLAPGTACGAAL